MTKRKHKHRTVESKADWEARVSESSRIFANSLGVPVPVMQCAYIGAQIDQLISGLDRPPQGVLQSLIEAAGALRRAGKLLEMDDKAAALAEIAPGILRNDNARK